MAEDGEYITNRNKKIDDDLGTENIVRFINEWVGRIIRRKVAHTTTYTTHKNLEN